MLPIARILAACTASLVLLTHSLHLSAQSPSGTQPSKRNQEFPWMSIATWERMHAEDMLVAEHDQIDLLFIGDSITAGWDWQLWQQHFMPLNAANFAVGADHTGNMLWRLQHGTIGQLQPKLIVILAGVNNFLHLQESPKQAAEGVTRLVQQVQLAWPNSKILLNALFPFDEAANSPNRTKVKQLNKLIAKLGDNKTIFVKDYGPLLLQKDGRISAEIMADFLHPTTKGYQIWAAAMLPDIHQLLH